MLATVAAWLACATTAAALTVMHGFADYTSLTLWVQTDRAATVAIEVAPEAGGEAVRRELATDAATDHVVSVRIPGLLPGTAYRYRIAAQGEAREGVAPTQRYWGTAAEAAELVIAIGSCHYVANRNPVFRGGGGDYQIFDAIAARRPDLMLWLGDNVYLQTPDFLDPASMAARYRQNRSFAPLQKLLAATAHLAILDDHDYGPNDADGSYVLKGESQRLFQCHQQPGTDRAWPIVRLGVAGRRRALPARQPVPLTATTGPGRVTATIFSGSRRRRSPRAPEDPPAAASSGTAAAEGPYARP
jgi:phosphodiesterase/alkaline phosphatase D-like protein